MRSFCKRIQTLHSVHTVPVAIVPNVEIVATVAIVAIVAIVLPSSVREKPGNYPDSSHWGYLC